MACWIPEHPELSFADSVGHARSAELEHLALGIVDVIDDHIEVELL